MLPNIRITNPKTFGGLHQFFFGWTQQKGAGLLGLEHCPASAELLLLGWAEIWAGWQQPPPPPPGEGLKNLRDPNFKKKIPGPTVSLSIIKKSNQSPLLCRLPHSATPPQGPEWLKTKEFLPFPPKELQPVNTG